MHTHSEATDALSQKKPLTHIRSRSAHHSEEPLPAVQPAVAIIDKWGIVNFSSPAMKLLFRCSQEQLEGREVTSLLPGLPFSQQTPDYNLAFVESWEQEATWRKLMGTSPTGDNIVLEVLLRKLRMENDQFILLGVRPASKDFGSDEELGRAIERASAKSDAVMVFNTNGIIQFVNPAFEKATGYSLSEAVGQPASFINPDFLNPDFYRKMLETLLAGNEVRSLFANHRKTDEIVYEDTHVRPFIDSFGVATHIVCTGRSLSEPLQNALLRLQREAYHDDLTGLPNRNLFLDRLKQSFSLASRRGEKLSLVFIDLDNFKEINDTYGHASGDAVLRTVASCLNASIRDEDTVARLGGDEFAIILLNTHQRKDVELVTNKILLCLAQGAPFEDLRIPVRASIGASIYPDDGRVGETLMKHADFAMYMAKSAGGHCFHFFDKDDELGRYEKEVAQELPSRAPEE